MDEILSCPWCKGQSVISGKLTPAYVECNECEATGPERPTPEEAIKVWNRMSSKLNSNIKYELPKTNIRYIMYTDGKYVCMHEDEWNKVRDKLLAWRALLIYANENDEEVDNG